MGLLGGLGKLVGKGIKLAKGGLTKVVPGGALAGGAIGVGSKILKRVGRKNLKRIAVGAGAATLATGGVMGIEGLMGGGGGQHKRYRRINPGNTRAMRRAIRRIEGGARLYSKFFSIKHGHIKHAPNVRLKKLSIRRAA